MTEFAAEQLGARAELRIAHRIYQVTALGDVALVARPSGEPRLASQNDLAFVARCYEEFVAEAGITFGKKPIEWAEAEIERGRAYLWDDQVPRTLACTSRETPTGRCIGPVHTPREFRRRGYATALVAEVTRQILASGKRFACLFTDEKNPTSNHIYETIGFRRVCRFDSYRIAMPARTRTSSHDPRPSGTTQ